MSPGSRAPLRILVIAGQNAVNNVKRNLAAQPILEVRDASDRPAPAAVLRLTAPSEGPGVRFANGSASVILVTETDGRVTVEGMTPRGLGAFDITVEASLGDLFATATIRQENSPDHTLQPVMPGETGASRHFASSGKHPSRTTVFLIVAGVAAAAAVGIALGLRNGGSSSSGVSIGVGTPTVGAPK